MGKLRLAAGALLFIGMAVLCHAEEGQGSLQRLELRLTERATPFVPTLSELAVSLPAGLFTGHRLLGRLEAHLHYLAYSVYLWPLPYFETCLSVDYAFVARPKVRVAGGIGTGIADTAGFVSVPFIGELRSGYSPWRWLRVEGLLRAMAFGTGFIGDAQVGALFEPLRRVGVLVGMGAGYSLAVPYTVDDFVGAFQLSATAGYAFSRGKRR